ncbi:VacJ family lipoprotein [uncultured Ferrovibrio sp.]|jgi:phospholipid-binding lipoprotein MlaA|uniref:MlaA family lipoprotein n=1 Tax=uncultured Ferrovibrio sp. TaxID=1576913 RepID=UPI002618C4A0|nr:VacJ family lipoprotein [uncultured Ferrovibrio sp.]
MPVALRTSKWKSLPLAIVLSTALLAGCATPPADPQARADFDAVNDPLEPVNRAMFELHQVIDHFLLKPVAFTYQMLVPDPVRTGIRSALINLRSPVILANDLLQGETGRAGNTLARFGINSTIGVLGFYDAADKWFGIEPHTEDFGQTLAVWGSGEGPYLFIPVLGPSNPRDLAGLAVDSVADPLNWYLNNTDQEEWIYARAALTGIDSRAELLETLDNLERTSLDYYVTLRSVYRQRRADEISNRRSPHPPVSPALSHKAEVSTDIEIKSVK